MDKNMALKKAKAVKMAFFDVDGVMTDGRFLLDESGNEYKPFSARDGLGIKLLISSGIRVAIISGRETRATLARARELGIEDVHTGGDRNKTDVMEEILKKHGISLGEASFVGDDLPDISAMKKVGFPVAVGDAAQEVKEVALLVTEKLGGNGAVREFAEYVLKAQDKWENVLRRFSH